MTEPVEVRFTASGAGDVTNILKEMRDLLQSIERSSAQMAAALSRVQVATKAVTTATRESAQVASRASAATASSAKSLENEARYAKLAADAIAAYNARRRATPEQRVVVKEGYAASSSQQLTETERALKGVTEATQELNGATARLLALEKEVTEAGKEFDALIRQENPDLETARQRIDEINAALSQLKSREYENTEVKKRLVESLNREKSALDRVMIALRQKAKETAAAGRASQHFEHQLGLAVKRFFLVGLGARTFMAAMIYLRTKVLEVAKAIYGQTEAYKALEDSTNRAAVALVTTVGTLIDAEAGMQGLTRAGKAFGEIMLMAGAGTAIIINTIGIGIRALKGDYEGLFKSTEEVMAFLTEEGRAAAERFFKRTLRDIEVGTGNLRGETEKYEQALDNTVRAIHEYNQAEAKHRQTMAEIEEAYRDAIDTVESNYASALKRIQDDLAEEIADINADAAKDRQEALEEANNDLLREQQQANDEIERMMEQHYLEMLHERQRHDLSMIQNERMYQYTRSKLVAEGDVLAIEDLDARYELERQAAQENFDLQMQQAEAMFQLQLKYQRQAIAEQVAATRAGLREELAAIEENRRERIATAEEKAEEERQAAAAERNQGYEEAKADRDKAIADELADWDDLLRQRAYQIAQEGLQLNKSAQQVDEYVVRAYGPNSPLRALTQQAYKELQTNTRIARDALIPYFGEIALAAQAAAIAIDNVAKASRALPRQSPHYSPSGGVRRYQYGGESIVNRPTVFSAGESYMPERVIVQPLSPIGGNISLSWHGGAIPVHGTGELSGVDMGAISNALARGLVTEMTRTIRGYRGQRGR